MTVRRHLLDGNVLIALSLPTHVHFEAAHRWLATGHQVAVCPISEGALVRFLVRTGEARSTITTMIEGVHSLSDVEFWADSLSYRDLDLAGVQGHRQVTDAYLVGLAASRGGRLATFDQALAATSPVAVLVGSDQ